MKKYIVLSLGLLLAHSDTFSTCKCCCACKKNQKYSIKKDAKQIIKNAYAQAAKECTSCKVGCCCKTNNYDVSKYLGYSDKELKMLSDANLGLGCGNPVKLSDIKEGETILDLGSGAGLDCLLAAKKTGLSGQVIGIDFTEEMIKKAQENAQKYNITNVNFILGDIEKLPLKDKSIDVILSNCVVNLAPNKDAVFNEANRVLKAGGRMFLSDIVLLENITDEQRQDAALIAGCVAGALLKDDYIKKIENYGFEIKVLGEDTKIRKQFYNNLPIVSLKLVAYKK